VNASAAPEIAAGAFRRSMNEGAIFADWISSGNFTAKLPCHKQALPAHRPLKGRGRKEGRPRQRGKGRGMEAGNFFEKNIKKAKFHDKMLFVQTHIF
jgi:hypothetical protein